jgi:tetrapyrrole methylase family protein / MazG family protein
MHEPRWTRIVWKVKNVHLRLINLDVEHEAIICQLHARRQPRVRLRMRQVVCHVREVGLSRRNPPCSGHRLAKREVRFVRCVTQRVEHEDVDAFDQLPRVVRNPVAVRQVRETAETEAEDRQLAVPEWDGHDSNSADGQRTRDFGGGQPGHTAAFLQRALEHIRELTPDRLQRLAVPVTRDRRALKRVETAEIIEPEDVIRVCMCEEDRIHARESVLERLLPQIRSRVDKDARMFGYVDVNRGSEASITRIGRPARRAAAADHRNAVRRPGAQHRDLAVEHPVALGRDDARLRLARLDKAQAQLEKDLIEQLPLFRSQVAARFRLEQRQDVDHLLCSRQVYFGLLTADGIRNVSEVNRGGVGKRENERGKADPLRVVLIVGVLVFGHGKTRMLAYEPMSTSHVHRRASAESLGEKFEQLVTIMRTLRAPDGCPWDREQTHASLRPFVLEETYEVLEAIDTGNLEELREELGDYLYEAVFLAQISEEAGEFSIGDAIDAIREKLVRRHPHVFAKAPDEEHITTGQVIERWETMKAREREAKGQANSPTKTTLSGVPKTLPSLLRAYEISARAAAVGFDWARAEEVLDKIDEEVAEVRREVESGATGHLSRAEEEMGDLLFAIANLSRKLGIEPEAALRRASEKFTTRFDAMERAFAARGKLLPDATLDEMEQEWQTVKRDT